MIRLLMFGLFLLVAIVNNAYAGTDMQCIQDCTSRGYLYQLCMQRCSFGDGGNMAQPKQNYQIPMVPAAQIDTTMLLQGGASAASQVTPFKPIDTLDPFGTIDVAALLRLKQMELKRQQDLANQSAVTVPPTAVWVKFYTDDTHAGYADTSSIRKNGELANILWMSDFKNAINLPGASGKSIQSGKFQDEFDCKEMRYRRHGTYAYSGNMGGGEIRGNFVYDSPKWVAVPHVALNEAARNYACGLKDQSDIRVPATEPTQSKSSAASRLGELNKLLQDGLITQKEFDAKKQEILKAL